MFGLSRPHQAIILASPIRLVSLPRMPVVIEPKTCSTHAHTLDRSLFHSVASALKGWQREPFREFGS